MLFVSVFRASRSKEIIGNRVGVDAGNATCANPMGESESRTEC